MLFRVLARFHTANPKHIAEARLSSVVRVRCHLAGKGFGFISTDAYVRVPAARLPSKLVLRSDAE